MNDDELIKLALDLRNDQGHDFKEILEVLKKVRDAYEKPVVRKKRPLCLNDFRNSLVYQRDLAEMLSIEFARATLELEEARDKLEKEKRKTKAARRRS